MLGSSNSDLSYSLQKSKRNKLRQFFRTNVGRQTADVFLRSRSTNSASRFAVVHSSSDFAGYSQPHFQTPLPAQPSTKPTPDDPTCCREDILDIVDVLEAQAALQQWKLSAFGKVPNQKRHSTTRRMRFHLYSRKDQQLRHVKNVSLQWNISSDKVKDVLTDLLGSMPTNDCVYLTIFGNPVYLVIDDTSRSLLHFLAVRFFFLDPIEIEAAFFEMQALFGSQLSFHGNKTEDHSNDLPPSAPRLLINSISQSNVFPVFDMLKRLGSRTLHPLGRMIAAIVCSSALLHQAKTNREEPKIIQALHLIQEAAVSAILCNVCYANNPLEAPFDLLLENAAAIVEVIFALFLSTLSIPDCAEFQNLVSSLFTTLEVQKISCNVGIGMIRGVAVILRQNTLF